jgi:hypothetical protein
LIDDLNLSSGYRSAGRVDDGARNQAGLRVERGSGEKGAKQCQQNELDEKRWFNRVRFDAR